MTAEDLKFEIESIPEKNVVVLGLKGALDAHTFEQFTTAVHELFDQGYYRLIMDLSGIEYISSAGVGVFFSSLSEARENDGMVVLMNISPSVRDVFNLLGLSQMFVIVEGREEALAQMSA